MTACWSCQADNPAEARFCNQCGSRLDKPAVQKSERAAYTPRHLADKILKTRAAIQGEKKRVTVLFCDIKGSTRLAEQAGPELWHTVLDRFFSILTGAVHKYEGTVNQYTGDGIMALFGAPIAHEDHAQRACLAALEMQAELRRYADELRLQHGLNLTLRVGLNTGEVIVGRIGDDLRMDYTAQGLTVNLAARMEHICEPGHIYLTRDTARLVEGYFRLRALGAMNVEGSSAPIEVSDLEGEGVLRTRLERGFSRGVSPFVGREQELAAMTAALERARQGEGAAIAVIGNAGLGKSRLCHEFVARCERSGVAVHRSTGVPYSGALPLFPVQALVKSRLGLPEHCKVEDARRLAAGTFLLEDAANAALLPALLEFLGFASATPDPSLRERLFEMLARWLPRAEGPLVLLVEDLHFADAASEKFLEQLARATAGTRTLLLFNYRPDYISEWLIPRLDEQLALSALSNEQICDLARDALGTHASLAGVAERICARANGNPYYAEEAVHALSDNGFLEGERGAYVLKKPIGEWRIPDTVHALIAARIDRLPEDHKSLLQSAAVIGQEFAPELLAGLAQTEPQPFEDTLAVLEETGFVHQKPEARERQYRFCHPLVQEVAYTAQLEASRAGAHARLAQLLEQKHPLTAPASAEAPLIAHHWARAGHALKAGAWALHAARWLGPRDSVATSEQFRNAVLHFDRAPDSPEATRGRVVARAGILRMVQFVSIDADEAEQRFREGRAMAQTLGDIPSLAEIHLSYANVKLLEGDAEAAVTLVTDAVKQAMAVGAGELAHRFRLQLLLVFNTAGNPREGVELINRAAGAGWITEPIGAENYMSRGFYGLMCATLGDVRAGERHVREAAAFAQKEDRTVSWMYANLVDIAFLSGDHEKAMPAARMAVEHAEGFGSPFFRAVAMRALAFAHVLQGSAAEAVTPMESLLPVVKKGGLAHQFEANYLATLAAVYRDAGRIGDARATAQAAVDSGRAARARVWEMVGWNTWLTLPAGDGWESRAPAALARFLELIESSGAESFRPWYWLARAQWSGDAAERDRCRSEARAAFTRIGADGHLRRLERA